MMLLHLKKKSYIRKRRPKISLNELNLRKQKRRKNVTVEKQNWFVYSDVMHTQRCYKYNNLFRTGETMANKNHVIEILTIACVECVIVCVLDPSSC